MNTRICKLIAVTVCWLLAIGTAVAQETKTVSGVVTDAATGQPLPGVIVEAYGNNRITALTDDKDVEVSALMPILSNSIQVMSEPEPST